MSRPREHGMSLIEALVALLLLSLLSTGILLTFRIAQRTYEQLTRAERAHAEVTTAQRLLRRLIESSYPFEPQAGAVRAEFGLEGSAERLRLTAHMPAAHGGAGHYRYELALVRSESARYNLIVRSWLDRRGIEEWGGSSGPAGAAAEEVLLSDIERLEWAYLERTDDGAPRPQWRSAWTSTVSAPALVRLRVAFAPEDPRRWPELLVAPRITDDANCEFDVIAQRCRRASL